MSPLAWSADDDHLRLDVLGRLVLADRLETDLIVTLDRRHFGVLRTPGGTPYRLLPDS